MKIPNILLGMGFFLRQEDLPRLNDWVSAHWTVLNLTCTTSASYNMVAPFYEDVNGIVQTNLADRGLVFPVVLWSRNRSITTLVLWGRPGSTTVVVRG